METALAPDVRHAGAPRGHSLRERLLALPPDRQRQVLDGFTPKHLAYLDGHPALSLRPSQVVDFDADWRIRAIVAGRRFGKNWAARAAIEEAVTRRGIRHIVLVGQTFADFERNIVNGPSSLRTLPSAPEVRGGSNPRLYWPRYGATAFFVSAEKPQGMYGLGCEFLWADEAGEYRTVQGVSAWDEIGTIASEGKARILITSSPYIHGPGLGKLRDLQDDPTAVLTRGATWENTALDQAYLDALEREHGGTRYYEAMVKGVILDEFEGAMFNSTDIRTAKLSLSRHAHKALVKACDRIVIAVDPAMTVGEKSDHTGIAVVGRVRRRHGDFALVFESAGVKLDSDSWAAKVGEWYEEYDVSQVLGETNQGGDNIHDAIRRACERSGKTMRYRGIHAVRDKAQRAERVKGRYSQRRVKHVYKAWDAGHDHGMLESEMLAFTGQRKEADDVLDAMVYGVRDLIVDGPQPVSSFAPDEAALDDAIREHEALMREVLG